MQINVDISDVDGYRDYRNPNIHYKTFSGLSDGVKRKIYRCICFLIEHYLFFECCRYDY